MRTRPAAVLGIVAVLVAVLAVVAALVSANRDHPAFDAGTPEGVVQLYVSALFNDGVGAAVEYLDPALGCSDPLPEVYIADTARVAVVRSSTSGDTATVDLSIEEGSGLEGGWSHRETYTLRRDGDTWVITGQPWPIHSCERWVD
ncbi:MAG: hypothetical protein ACQERF_00575 [Actinomycetota bacterium]